MMVFHADCHPHINICVRACSSATLFVGLNQK
jgi:hypothetical protein